MSSITISFPDEINEWIQDRIKSGKYVDVCDYVSHLIVQDKERVVQRLESTLRNSSSSPSHRECDEGPTDEQRGAYSSTVKWFNDAKGYGFIEHPEIPEACFAHYSAILKDGYKTLKGGELVTFDTCLGPKGIHAINIRPA